MKALITGVAGFIGFHLAKKLIAQGHEVYGIDNLYPSQEDKLKTDRLINLASGITFFQVDIFDKDSLEKVFNQHRFEKVFHLAAHGGVAASTANPHIYMNANIEGFLNVLESSRRHGVRHLVYASSSSVYGANSALPQSVTHPVDHPLSFYAVTKRANELMAHSFSHIYQLPTTGLRFFTVYGPWGRPDMAIFRFTKAILESQPIEVFAEGRLKRDFTFIDDAISGILAAAELIPQAESISVQYSPDSSHDPFRIRNIGSGQPVSVLDCLSLLEKILGKSAKRNHVPIRPEDLRETHSDISGIHAMAGFCPQTSLEAGLRQFCDWYREYYKIK